MAEICPFCRSEVNRGADVCASCGAYKNKESSFLIGMINTITWLVMMGYTAVLGVTLFVFFIEGTSFWEIKKEIFGWFIVLAILIITSNVRGKTVWKRRM